jgi:hypothetical protein
LLKKGRSDFHKIQQGGNRKKPWQALFGFFYLYITGSAEASSRGAFGAATLPGLVPGINSWNIRSGMMAAAYLNRNRNRKAAFPASVTPAKPAPDLIRGAGVQCSRTQSMPVISYWMPGRGPA